jgi:hypothetical protein
MDLQKEINCNEKYIDFLLDDNNGIDRSYRN